MAAWEYLFYRWQFYSPEHYSSLELVSFLSLWLPFEKDGSKVAGQYAMTKINIWVWKKPKDCTKLKASMLLFSLFCFQFAGMDVTVTAPLETGAGHQRLVIAYTLKQAIEKQPDILNAQQKITMSSSGTGVKQPSSTSSSPLSNRPNALFIGKPTFTSSDYVSINRELLSIDISFPSNFFRTIFFMLYC